MVTIFIAVLTRLFSIVNPVGAVPLYLTLSADHNDAERNRVSLNASIYTVGIMLAFFWGGAFILSFFGLSVYALRIAGGLVILKSGYDLLNDKFNESRAMNDAVQKEAMEKPDISFSPMAMPMLSGPGTISLLVSFFAEYQNFNERLTITLAIIANGILVYFILRSAKYFYRILGVTGLKAGSRIMSFITMAIGVQFIIGGIVALVKNS